MSEEKQMFAEEVFLLVIEAAGGLMLIKPGLMTDLIGVSIFAAILIFQLKKIIQHKNFQKKSDNPI